MHHRIKNNMQLVSSLINLQLKYSFNDNVFSILNESKSRFKVLNILNKTALKDGVEENIEVSNYINSIVLYLHFIAMNNK